jgi:CelD/BcsL family acetyltransferase involved in cellulose biosynthesis
LSAGGEVIAVHLGASHEGRTYWWIPSYGPEFAKFSPGRLMLESLLRASFERGDHEFDFLIGEEAYKWHYATHTRVIGAAGTPPLSLRVEKELKRQAKRALRGMPWLLDRSPWLKERALR